MAPHVAIERRNGTATIHVRGDLVLAVVPRMYDKLRTTIRRRDVRHVILDLSQAERLDSAAAATVTLCTRLATSLNKELTLAHVATRHQAMLDLVPSPV